MKYYVEDQDKDKYSITDDLYLYFKISKKSNLDELMNINSLDLLYTLRANSPSVFAENVNLINNIQPNNCHFTKDKNYPLPIIVDGYIDKDVLKEIKKDEKWINNLLDKKGIKLEDVFYAFYKHDGTYIITYKDLI